MAVRYCSKELQLKEYYSAAESVLFFNCSAEKKHENDKFFRRNFCWESFAVEWKLAKKGKNERRLQSSI